MMINAQTKQKILVIDDDPEIAMVLKSRLEFADYKVAVAHDGRKGLQKIKDYKPDLVVLDVMMDDLTGYEVCAEIKNNAEYNHLPVIMLTSRIRSIDENLGFACKADAYIRKPYSSELLLPEIKKLLKNRLQET